MLSLASTRPLGATMTESQAASALTIATRFSTALNTVEALRTLEIDSTSMLGARIICAPSNTVRRAGPSGKSISKQMIMPRVPTEVSTVG